MRLVQGDGRQNRGRRIYGSLQKMAPRAIELIWFPHARWFTPKVVQGSSRQQQDPCVLSASVGRADPKVPEPFGKCDPKYLLTTVIPKLYRKTVGG
jgi:hypothetical protein